MANILHKELSYTLNGILFEVHNKVGKFASEQQICDLIESSFKHNNVVYVREFVLPTVSGEQAGRHRVDFLIDNKMILEIKYRKFLTKDDYDQVKRYLSVLNLALGVLVNFRENRLHPKRILNGGDKE